MPSKVSGIWKHVLYVTLGIMCPQRHLSICLYLCLDVLQMFQKLMVELLYIGSDGFKHVSHRCLLILQLINQILLRNIFIH